MPSHPDAPSRSQSANLSGESVNVQIQGDNNVVLLGRSRLDLTLYRGRRREAVSSSGVEAGEAAEILSPYAMAVPLIGRERELADLRAWMAGDPDLSIRVMTAPGGGGKTRLALELCEEAVRQGWNAGFVKTAAPVDSAVASLARPTLAVVDYAAARLSWLRDWLDDLASSPPGGGKLRILLLERYADPNSGWWAEAFQSGGWGDRAVRARLDPADRPYELSPLTPIDQRRAILLATLKSIRSNVGLPNPQERPDFDRRLAELSWGGEPLFLIMAALTAHRCGLGYVLALDRSRLAFDVAEHELARIGKIAESRSPRARALTRHMAAYVTLCQGLKRDQVEDAIEVEARALRYRSAGDPAEIYRSLHAALPGAGADVTPILPDVVGEAAILLALGDGDSGRARESVARAAALVPECVSAAVIRMAQDFGGVDGRPLEWLDCLAERAGDTQALVRLVRQLPRETLALREMAARLTSVLVERLRTGGDKEELARSCNDLSVRLGALGRREEALGVAQESVDVWRALSRSRPNEYPVHLPMSLTNLSLRLSALGRHEEALGPIQEAVDAFRKLSQLDPETFRPNLVLSLNVLSNLLSALGRREEALEAAQESLALHRELAQDRPEALRPDRAGLLMTRSNRLSTLGRREEALEAVQEAVAILRELAQPHPDTFRSDLAASLHNLAFRLQELGRPGEALEASDEAVRFFLPLFQAFPAAFWDRMSSATNLYLKLSEENGRQLDPELITAIASTLRKCSPDPGSPS